jgi:hypothetical protein
MNKKNEQKHPEHSNSQPSVVTANCVTFREEILTVTVYSVFLDTNMLIYQTFGDFDAEHREGFKLHRSEMFVAMRITPPSLISSVRSDMSRRPGLEKHVGVLVDATNMPLLRS